ncbi:hypothetical protein [Kineococcus sp. SYSU DK006]|uniref:hypothetical protein n=1 Tax=Kineococcus sp. SYSU DK006 TaxID=3383127 RepID=UPI003D7CE3FE
MRRPLVHLAAALAAGTVGIGALALVSGSVPGVAGLGPLLAEAQGHTDRAVHSRPAQVPAADLPDWARAGEAEVTVVRPGEAAGEGAGEAVRADLAVPAGFTLPATCAPVERVGMPFDGGGDEWPDSRRPGHRCGGWSAVVAGDHLYVWR